MKMMLRPTIVQVVAHASGTAAGVFAKAIGVSAKAIGTATIAVTIAATPASHGRAIVDRLVIGSAICVSALRGS
jgi:hypothetical protein